MSVVSEGRSCELTCVKSERVRESSAEVDCYVVFSKLLVPPHGRHGDVHHDIISGVSLLTDVSFLTVCETVL